ncbi:hypothetical protein GCM10027346_32630 [Hymenobacter seoulensis]
MKNELQCTVYCQLTLAEMEYGEVVNTKQVEQQVACQTTELNELFADLYEQFRSPELLGLQITSIQYPTGSGGGSCAYETAPLARPALCWSC